jgi:protocatechuate 3,4-dioxygenase beta subunit
MDRKQFIKNGLKSLGAIVALPSVLAACSDTESQPDTGTCSLSPSETTGPFPIKTPADLVLENITSDRTGVALLMTLTVQDRSSDCQPLAGVLVDVWHCDADGNYSEYGANAGVNFLRGRQATDINGQVSFISIFPGWYPGRAPHIHVEVLEANGDSIRVTQIAFPKDICDVVYSTDGYNGTADTTNQGDGIFANSLAGNMADSVAGNTMDGYTLVKTLIV